MDSFTYVDIDTKGKEVKGSVQAETKEAALANVKAMGLVPVSVVAQNFLNKDLNVSFSKKASVRDMSLFCRQFASLLRAGVTIVDALGMLSDSTSNKGLAKSIDGLATTIQKGETLGIAMRQYPEYYDSMLVSLVDAGEASGSLENSLDRMASQYEKTSKLQGTIKKAMIYPIIVIIVAIAVVIVMLAWIVPTFMKMFEGLDIEMPKLTLAVVAVSNFVKDNIIIILLALVVFVIAFMIFRKSARGQAFFSYLGVRLPAISDFTVKSAAARMARTLSTLTGSGLSLVEALEITAHTMNNVLFRDALMDAKEQVMKGVPLSEPLQRSGIFPMMVVHMVRIGEDTGDLDGMLQKLSDYYDEEVELATQSLLAALEPIIILLLTVVVGVIIAAVMGPMIKLYTGLDAGL